MENNMNKYILLQEILRKMHDQQDKYPLIHDVLTPFPLVEEIIDNITLTSSDTILTLNLEFAVALIHKYNVEPKRITIFADACRTTKTFATKLGINYIDAWNDNMKFDVVFGNPPYEGKKALHQQFFNKAVDELVIDGGTVCFVQPDTAYVSKKPRQKKPNKEMMQNIMRFKADVAFKEGTVFESAAVATSLAITILTKVEDGTISVEYINGDKYDHIDLRNINKLGVSPNIYESIKDKIESYIDKNGCLHDISEMDGDSNVYKVSKIRGHVGCDDFYTIVQRDASAHSIGNHNFGFLIEKGQEKSVYSYLKSFVARYALSIYKTNTNNHMGEFKIVPLVPFDRIWTDEMLCEEIGIADSEYEEILKHIPEYY
jgi:hypothetical protein